MSSYSPYFVLKAQLYVGQLYSVFTGYFCYSHASGCIASGCMYNTGRSSINNRQHTTIMGHSQGTITLAELPELKVEYERAAKEGAELFKFKGNDLYTDYAKYLIQHMENVEKKHPL